MRADVLPERGLGDLRAPHPFLAVAQNPSAICFKQRVRRAEILAQTRELLAIRGYSDLSVRQVADRSGVAVQTIYNLLGQRRELVATAVTEHISSMMREAYQRSNWPNPVVGYCNVLAQSVAIHRNYMRNATLTYFPPERPLFEQIRFCSRISIRQALHAMDADGWLKTRDIDGLSVRITSLLCTIMLDGLTGCGTDLLPELQTELCSSVPQLLMDAATPVHAEKIEHCLQHPQYT